MCKIEKWDIECLVFIITKKCKNTCKVKTKVAVMITKRFKNLTPHLYIACFLARALLCGEVLLHYHLRKTRLL